jgi:hypothetical protein
MLPAPVPGSVRARLFKLIGSEIHQPELIALRRGLFKDILPAPTREEKRLWCENMVAFECHRDQILPLLDFPEFVSRVQFEVLRLRKPKQRRPMFIHLATGGFA